jgi:WD40 repeat protein/serine/threonine protein kinase
MTHALALPPGTELVGDYRIERVLGAGGFGITYLAEELSLARDVTIKEYFPGDYASRNDGRDAVPRSQDCAGDYQWGLDRFIEEAQTLARFDHRNIVRVYRYFRANNTGYMVLHFEEGQSLKSWLKALGRAPRQKEIDRLVAPLLDALELIHKADFLHRDIAPDNVIIRKDGTPVLIDFGAARGEIAQHSRTVSALVKPGYSPYEQYAENGKQQGPWSDIYALGATLYHAVTGKRPPDAPSRVVKDEFVPAREAAISSYRAGFLAAIDRSLQLDIDKRPQSVAAWRGALLAPDPPKPGWLARTIERSLRPAPPSGGSAPPAAPGSAPLPATPPPPDVPVGQGRLLDYIDQLKERSGGKAVSAKNESGGKPVAPPETASTPAPAATPAQAKRAVVAAPRRGTERPRPVRTGGRRWRPLVVKLIIGAGIAAAAVGLQDRLPRFDAERLAAPETRHTETKAAADSRPARPVVRDTAREQQRDAVRESRDGAGPGVSNPAAGSPAEIKAHRGSVAALAWSEDGRQLVTAGADATIKIWDGASGALVRSVDTGNGPPSALAVLNRRALSGHADGNVVLWDLDRGEALARFRRSEAAILAVAFAGDANRFIAAGQDRVVAMWDTQSSAQPAFTYDGHQGAVQALAYAARSGLIVSGGNDRRIRLWDGASVDALRVYRGHRDAITALAFSPDGRLFASAGLDGSIRLWSVASYRLQRSLSGHAAPVTGLAFGPSGDQLASTGGDGTLRIWDLRRQRLVRSYGDGAGVFKALAYTPDGRRIAVAGDDGIVRLWDGSPVSSDLATTGGIRGSGRSQENDRGAVCGYRPETCR